MKNAYVSVLSDDQDDFIYNLLLGYSIYKTKTKYDIVLLYTLDVPQHKIELLRNFYTHIIRIEHVQTLQKRFQRSLSYFFTKFQVFTLTQYQKVLYLDKFQFVTQNIDYLFALETPASFCYHNKLKRSHMFLIRPNKDQYDKALSYIDETNLTKKYIDKDIFHHLFENKKLHCFSRKIDFQIQMNAPGIPKIIDYNFIKKPDSLIGKNKKIPEPSRYYIEWLQDYIYLFKRLQKRNIDLHNVYSVVSNDYMRYLKHMFPKLEKEKLSSMQQKELCDKLREPINVQYTFMDIIKIFINNNIPLFIYGGSIRDLYNGGEIRDVDFYYIADYKRVKSLLKSIPHIEFKQGLFKKYFNIEDDEMELSNLDIIKKSLDSPCNGLLYDLKTNLVYALNPYSIHDSKHKIWRMPPGDTFEEWSRDHNNLLYRLVKFIDKGYTIPLKDRQNIYNELFYQKKDRTYWFFLKSPKYNNDQFFNTIRENVNQSELPYTGDQFIQMMRENLDKL